MRTVFADSGYWIALLNPTDDLHNVAHGLSRPPSFARLTTSEMVLVEVLNYFAGYGPGARQRADQMVRLLKANAGAIIIPQTSALFNQALDLYGQRPDKNWSITDCASFVIMRDLDISEALAHDRHFVQAGFTALLRDDT